MIWQYVACKSMWGKNESDRGYRSGPTTCAERMEGFRSFGSYGRIIGNRVRRPSSLSAVGFRDSGGNLLRGSPPADAAPLPGSVQRGLRAGVDESIVDEAAQGTTDERSKERSVSPVGCIECPEATVSNDAEGDSGTKITSGVDGIGSLPAECSANSCDQPEEDDGRHTVRRRRVRAIVNGQNDHEDDGCRVDLVVEAGNPSRGGTDECCRERCEVLSGSFGLQGIHFSDRVHVEA